jgi:hypothetical protein
MLFEGILRGAVFMDGISSPARTGRNRGLIVELELGVEPILRIDRDASKTSPQALSVVLSN